MRRDAQANRDRILAAAEAVFGTAGGAGSTEEVARQAGVGIGTVFRHFPTKRDLIEATVVRHFDDLTARAGKLAAAPDPGAALRKMVERMIGGTAAKVVLIGLLVSEDGTLSGPAERASLELRRAVGTLLHRAQAAGTVRPDVSVDELYLLIRALSQAAGQAPGRKAVLRKAVDVVLDGLAAQPGGG